MLGIPHAIVHPGAHMGAGEDAGLATVARSLDDALRVRVRRRCPCSSRSPRVRARAVGHRFEHLAEILARATVSDRLGVCLDTCHMFASGYDIASPRGFERAMDAFDDDRRLRAARRGPRERRGQGPRKPARPARAHRQRPPRASDVPPHRQRLSAARDPVAAGDARALSQSGGASSRCCAACRWRRQPNLLPPLTPDERAHVR